MTRRSGARLAMGRDQWLVLALGLVAGGPILVTTLTLFCRSWIPIGDEAAMLEAIRGVGTSQSPINGAYSIRGWSHPGPLGYYLVAPLFRLFGSHPIDVFKAAGLLNLAWVMVAIHLVHRRRGKRAALLATVFMACLVFGMSPVTQVSVWNPHLAMIPYAVFLFACWGVAERDRRSAWIAVLTGSLIAQLHVAYLPLVGAGAAVAVVLATVEGWRPARLLDTSRNLALALAGGTAVLWSPVVIDQLLGQGNSMTLVRYFTSGTRPAQVGPGAGIEMLSARLAPFGNWMGGSEPAVFGVASGDSVVWLAVLAGLLTAVAAAAWFAAKRGAGWAAVLALTQLGVAAVASGRLERPVITYLLVWVQPLAAFAWFAVVAGTAEVLGSFAPPVHAAAGEDQDQPHPAPRWLAWGLGTLCLALAVTQMGRGLAAERPVPVDQRRGAVALRLFTQIKDRIPEGPLRVEGVGEPNNVIWVGVLHQIMDSGGPVLTSDGISGLKWGRNRRYVGQPVTTVLTIAVDENYTTGNWVDACEADPTQTRVGLIDDLTAAERLRLKELRSKLYFAPGHQLAPPERAEADGLRRRQLRIGVWSGPEGCRPPGA